MIKEARATAALVITAMLVATACGGGDSSPSHSSASSQSSAASAAFTSDTYGYSLTLPEGWTSRQAVYKWDGLGALNRDAVQADQFRSTSNALAFAAAAPWLQSLASYTRRRIVLNHRFHGDTCPRKPETTSPVTIGGQPGELLAYNCGILVDLGATVRGGVGYLFSFVDPDVDAATDPTDSATFLAMLRSVRFSG